MWTYEIAPGKFFDDNGTLQGICYSGGGAGKNNPEMQNVKDVGPLPCGYYTFGEPVNSTEHGPFAIPLIPDTDNQMFGRCGFMFHGDSIEHPGCASEGCLIGSLGLRTEAYGSDDHRLHVVPGIPAQTPAMA